MSWKLAELRWRQEVGLRDSSGDIGKGAVQEDNRFSTRKMHNERPITEPIHPPTTTAWSRLSWKKPRDARLSEASSLLLRALVLPNQESLDFSPHVSISSTAPLLKLPRNTSTASLGSVGPARVNRTRKFSFQQNKPLAIAGIPSPATREHSSSDFYPPSIATSEIPVCAKVAAYASGDDCATSTAELQTLPTQHSRRTRSRTFGPPESSSSFSASSPFHVHDNETSSRQPRQSIQLSYSIGVRSTLEEACRPRSANSTILESKPTPEQRPGAPLVLSGIDFISYSTSQNLSSGPKHHSDSLLEKYLVDKSTHSSKRQRATGRHLYPDLPSAHAKILGHKNMGDDPEASSETETRFPLALSASSDEGEELENLTSMSIQGLSIPMHRLQRHEVRSAHGVLREAEHHQESSAVFETSDILDDPIMSLTESNTLDDILSQYADHCPPDSSDYHRALRGIEDMLKGSESICPRSLEKSDPEFHWGAEQRIGQPDQARDISPRHTTLGNFPQIFRSSPFPSLEQMAESGDYKEFFERVPQGGRCGFLTPSKMRFRLTKQDSPEATNSSCINDKHPTLPWDPLAELTPRGSKQRLRCIRHPRHKQNQSPTLREIGTERALAPPLSQKQVAESQEAYRPSQLMDSQKYAPPPPSARSRGLSPEGSYAGTVPMNTPQLDSLLSGPLFPRQDDTALPSSSLLPEFTVNPKKTSLSPATGSSSGTSLSKMEENVLFHSSLLEQHQSSSPYPEMRIHGLEPRDYRRLHKSAVSTDSITYKERRQEDQNIQRCPETAAHGQTCINQQPQHALLARQLFEGQYTDSDDDISRFLRDHRVNDKFTPFPEGYQVTERQDNRFSIKAAGSSLADYSSSSMPFGHTNKLENRLPASPNFDGLVGSGRAVEDDHSFRPFLPPPQPTTGNISSYSGLSKVDSGQVTLISSDSTSASLLSQHQPLSPDVDHVQLEKDRCPAFPLTPDQLAIKSLPNKKNPFERVQLMENGEWLERAWCFVHKRSEFNHTQLGTKRGQKVEDEWLEYQRQAVTIVLAAGVITYFVGGFVLVDDMAEQGSLSQMAMSELIRWLSRRDDGFVGGVRVRASDARLARVIARTGTATAVLVLVACFVVCVWVARTS